MLRWVILGLVSIVTLSACGAAAPATSPSPSLPASGVEGVVLMVGGPMAVGPGGTPIPNSPRPWPGAGVVVHEGGVSGPVVAETKAARDGSFRIDLPPGEYTLVPQPMGGTPTEVTVTSGGYATVELLIHVP
jgi:hypothetical protein